LSNVLPQSSSVHPAHSSSNPSSPTLGQIDAVMASHLRLYGTPMDWREAIRRLDRFNVLCCQDGYPAKQRDVLIGCFLIGETYSREAIHRILAHVAIFKTAHGAPDIDVDDAEAVDAILPARPAGERDAYAAHYFLGV
jgi:hypothetical protein